MSPEKLQLLEELVKTPLVLLSIKDGEMIDAANNVLPYSVGVEINACTGNDYQLERFQAIPDMMEVNNNSTEQRFRIPNGIRGLICLYNLSIQFGVNLELNPTSGIHYHIDCSDCFGEIGRLFADRKLCEYILKELDTWEYDGTYNSRGISASCAAISGNWLRHNWHQTLEFRVGNMTFDYEVLIKRIRHATRLVKELKDRIRPLAPPVFEPVDVEKVTQYLRMHRAAFSNRYQNLLAKVEEERKMLQVKETLNNLPLEEQIIPRKRKHIIE